MKQMPSTDHNASAAGRLPQLSARDRRAITLGAIVLGIALLSYYVVLPGIDRWQAARADLDQYEVMLVDLQTRLDRRDAVLTRLEEKYGPGVHQPLADVETLRTAFPERVQELLGKGGIGFESIELQGVQKLRDLPGVSIVSVRVQGMSNPNAVAKFMAQTSAADQLVLIDRLQMTRKDKPDQWTVSLVLSTLARDGGSS